MLLQSLFITFLDKRIITSTTSSYNGNTVTFNSDDDFQDSNLLSEITSRNINAIVLAEGITRFTTHSVIQFVPKIIFQSSQITSIPKFAFSHNYIIDTVELSQYVTEIQEAAFFSSSISTINFEHVQTIQPYAFYECYNLKNIDINNVKISSLSFAYSGLERILNYRDYFNSDSNASFIGCRNLISVTINNQIVDSDQTEFIVPDFTFYNCISLSQVSFTSNEGTVSIESCSFYRTSISQLDFTKINYIGRDAFSFCKFKSIERITCELNQFSFSYNEELISVSGSNTFAAYWNYGTFSNCNKLTTFSSTACELIKEYTFSDCVSLVSVEVPQCTIIDSYAFKNCYSLKSIHVKSSDNLEIGEYAFFKCKNLTSFPADRVTSFGSHAFVGCDSLNSFPNFIVVDGAVIGDNAFNSFQNIITLTFTSATLNEFCFTHCTSLTTIHLGNSITSIPMGCFYGCTKLNSIDLSNVNEVGFYAFGKTESLTEITFGVVSTIADRAFEFSGIRSVTFKKAPNSPTEYLTVKIYDNYPALDYVFPTFRGCKSLTTIYYGPEVEKLYPSMFFEQKNIQVVPLQPSDNHITNINDVLFSGNSLIYYLSSKSDLSYTIPDNTESIEEFAFIHANNLKKLTINKDINTPNFMCACCSNLESIIYEFTPKPIPEYLFYAPKYEIGKYAFYNCPRLTTVTLPDKLLLSINEYAFQHCNEITYFNLTYAYYVRKCAFSHCTNLKSIDGSINTHIDHNSLEYTALTEVNVSASMIASGVYSHCKYLKKVNFIDSPMTINTVYEVGLNCFEYCPIETLTGTEYLHSVRNDAFAYTKLKYFEVPSIMYRIESLAFRGLRDFKVIVCNHPRYIATDHELIDKTSNTLVMTFGDLPSTYVVPSFVKHISEYSINSEPIFHKKSGQVISFGVTTIIVKSGTEIDRSAFFYCPFLYNLCYDGPYKPQSIQFYAPRVFVTDDFDPNEYLYYNLNVIKGKCDTSVPYKDFAKGNFWTQPSGEPEVYKPRDVYPVTVCNEDLKSTIKYDEDPDEEEEEDETGPEPVENTNNTETSNIIQNSTTSNVYILSPEEIPSKSASPLLIVLIILACIEIVVISALMFIIIMKNREEDSSESSVVLMKSETITTFTTTADLVTDNPLYLMTGIDDDPFAKDFNDEGEEIVGNVYDEIYIDKDHSATNIDDPFANDFIDGSDGSRKVYE